VDVKYKGGAPREETRRRIEAAVKGATSIFVYDVADLKRVGDETMDRTLRLTNVQVAVSVIIGFLGIVNTLLISVMGRTREIGLLRAVGMTKAQVAGMILVESLFVAGIGAGLGVALGLAGARWPLALHVAQISGYWMPLYVPWETIGLAVGAAFVIGALASVLPARRAAGINVLQAVKYE
jgi:putative ABC transport system permease protein